MQIEDQIKVLLRTKAKIDLFRSVQRYLQTDMIVKSEFEAEYPGLFDEFIGEALEFCDIRIETLGNPIKVSESKRVKESISPAAQPTPPQNSDVEDEPTDILKFLAKYKYLDSKRVVYTSKDGDVQGIVRGMIAPFLKIELDTGYVINVAPKSVKEIK